MWYPVLDNHSFMLKQSLLSLSTQTEERTIEARHKQPSVGTDFILLRGQHAYHRLTSRHVPQAIKHPPWQRGLVT